MVGAIKKFNHYDIEINGSNIITCSVASSTRVLGILSSLLFLDNLLIVVDIIVRSPDGEDRKKSDRANRDRNQNTHILIN